MAVLKSALTRSGLLALVLSLGMQPGMADYGASGNGTGATDGGASIGLSSRTTRKVVRVLTRDFNRCTTLDKVYRYDCYRQTYKLAVDEIAGNPSYRRAYQALERVEQTLTTITRNNRDTSKPAVRKGFQTYTAIKPEAVPQSKVQLRQALDEAETVLLRSAADTGQVHFAQIAEAVNSNKVLLRSMLQQLLRRFA